MFFTSDVCEWRVPRQLRSQNQAKEGPVCPIGWHRLLQFRQARSGSVLRPRQRISLPINASSTECALFAAPTLRPMPSLLEYLR